MLIKQSLQLKSQLIQHDDFRLTSFDIINKSIQRMTSQPDPI